MPTVKIRSNYDRFRKRLLNLPYRIDEAMQEAVKEVLEAMCEDMKFYIMEYRDTWLEEGSGLDAIDKNFGLGEDIEYELNGSSGTIYVGRHTPDLVMSDGQHVNPYLFIQFGYGIAGALKPVRYSIQSQWAYNVNGHEDAWWYMGYFDGERKKVYTKGRQGIDFFYKTIDKYRNKWKEIATEALLRHLDY